MHTQSLAVLKGLMISIKWLKVQKKASNIEIYKKMQAVFVEMDNRPVTFVERELENSKKVVLKEKWTSWCVLIVLGVFVSSGGMLKHIRFVCQHAKGISFRNSGGVGETWWASLYYADLQLGGLTNYAILLLSWFFFYN
ncbi:variant 2, Boron transporter 4 [Lathyrus oleraceus]|uniref:Variant 2, Boron transporter 4 n=1 Tax=Pisum sativum TaxID=3888 RepID=A0A9D5AU65_PEA|nr:variant 2, Boron transporter 4 [Pisum sativum]